MQEIKLQVILDDIRAKANISALQTQLNKLKELGETGIKLNFNENGELVSVFSRLKDASGAIVDYVRTWDSETQKLEEKSAKVSYNFEQMQKNSAAIEQEAKRLLAQEEELSKKTAERAQREKEISAQKERQAQHNSRQRELELTFANYDEYIKSLNLTEEQLEKMGLSSDKAKDKTKQLGDQAQKTGGQFTLLNTIIIRLAHTALTALTRAFREALTEMKNVDTQLTTISRITQTNISDLDALKNKAYEVGNQYGVLASDYLSAAAAFTRAGYREQAEDLAELSSKMQIAGQVSAETANQLLIATDKAYGFNGSVTELSSVMDKMTVIDHNYATSVEKIAEGIGLVAPIASQAHMSMDELIAAMGTITAVTQRSGSESARALRALILSIIKDTTTEIEEGVTWTVEEINTLQDALKTYAPTVVAAAEATGTLIDPMEAIAALSKAYEEGLLTEAKLADITSKLGGKLRASQLLSLIQNYSGMYTQMMADMGNAIGAVDKDVDKALQSWEVKLNQLKNTFTKFVQDSLDTNFIKGLIDSVNWLITGFGNLGTAVVIFGGALIALKIPSIIQGFSNLAKMITKVGGGFINAVTSLLNYKTMSGMVVEGNYEQAASFAAAEAAASAYTLIIAAVAIAISASVIAINKYKQKLDEAIERGKKAYEELKSLESLEEDYKNLEQKYKDGTISQEEYAKGKDEVIKKLDEEGVWVDTVTGKYETLEEKIQGAIDASKEYKLIEIDDAIRALEEKSQFGFLDNSIARGNKTAEIADYLGVSPSKFTGSSSYSYKKEYDLDALVEIYDKAIEKRKELYDNGQYGSYEDKRLQAWIESAEEVVTQYKELKEKRDEYLVVASDNGEDTVIRKTDETAKSIKGLADELTSATKALDEYNKKLKEGGEKGDSFKSYADAYKKAVEMYEKGLTGSNQYMSAIELIFGKVEDYEAAGKLLGNAFVKSMFEGGGDDYGANAANYIRTHINEFEGVQITQGENGTFGLMVTDMEKFAESTGLSADALWTLIDALDIFNSKTTYTRDQLFDFMGLEDDGREKFVNLTAMINDLAGQGKSAREIKGIVEAIKELAETDGNITISEPENLDQTIDDVVELNKEAEKDKDIEVVLTSNSEEFFDGIKKEINQINGSTIYIGLKYKSSLDNLHGVRGRYTYASGTKSARGGMSLVNEEGAEIIYANGKAWIAGGGEPTLTNIPSGAGVFNAKETRDILTRSGINSFAGGYVGGIPDSTTSSSVASKIVSGKSGKSKLTKELLDKIADYINDILKKAKDALDAQLKAIDAQIEALEREHNAEEDKNKLEELRLKVLEAEKRLEEAKNERTVRYFNKETGQWEWMADQKAVYEAEKALKEAQEAYDKEVAEQAYNAQIQALKDLKKALQDQYNDLEDHWEEIYNALKENGKSDVNFEKLLKSLGLDKNTTGDIRELIKVILEYEKKMESGSYDMPLDSDTVNKILGAFGTQRTGTNTVGQIFGISTADSSAKGTSLYSTASSIVGDTIYYINGLKIGADMMDKPLSEILSRLSIYAN